MYVQKDVTGWLVCEEDGDILKTFRGKGAATRWMREMKEAIEFDNAMDADEVFLAIHGPFPKG